MKNYKVQVNLVRKNNPDEVVETIQFQMTSHQNLGAVLCQTLWDNGIDADQLEYYKVEVELINE